MCDKDQGWCIPQRTPLTEEIAEQLAAVSLLLAAATTRLNRERHPVAGQLQIAARQLSTSLGEVLMLTHRATSGSTFH